MLNTAHTKWSITVELLISLLFLPSALRAAKFLLQIWPTFRAYNQQLSTRLYVSTPADANCWVAHAAPAGIIVTNLSYNAGDLFQDVYNGAGGIQSGFLAAGAGWHTLQLASPFRSAAQRAQYNQTSGMHCRKQHSGLLPVFQ